MLAKTLRLFDFATSIVLRFGAIYFLIKFILKGCSVIFQYPDVSEAASSTEPHFFRIEYDFLQFAMLFPRVPSVQQMLHEDYL